MKPVPIILMALCLLGGVLLVGPINIGPVVPGPAIEIRSTDNGQQLQAKFNRLFWREMGRQMADLEPRIRNREFRDQPSAAATEFAKRVTLSLQAAEPGVGKRVEEIQKDPAAVADLLHEFAQAAAEMGR